MDHQSHDDQIIHSHTPDPNPGLRAGRVGTFVFNPIKFSLTIHCPSGRAYQILVPAFDTFLAALPSCLEELRFINQENRWRSLQADGGNKSFILDQPENSVYSDCAADWAQVQGIGRYCPDGCATYDDQFAKLFNMATKVFSEQPDRKSVQGFFMRGPLFEACIFQKSGQSYKYVIDIRTEYLRFLARVSSYQAMTEGELGEIAMTYFFDDDLGKGPEQATNAS